MGAMRSLIALVGLLAACASTPTPVSLRSGGESGPSEAEWYEAFYAARSVDALDAVVAKARAAQPDSAVTHALLAERAQLAMDLDGAIEHRMRALGDREAAAPVDLFDALEQASMTSDQRDRWIGLLDALGTHPNAEVVSRAEFARGRHLWFQGEAKQAHTLEARRRGGLAWKIIGAWDNDQGKAFDEVLPPERNLDFNATYEGALLDIGWRNLPAAPPTGHSVDMGATVSPAVWAVAYAVTAFEVAEAGTYHVEVAPSVPTKVWLDGELVLAARISRSARPGAYRIPVQLESGVHRVLVKSAQDTGPWRFDLRMTGGELRPRAPDAAPTGGGRRLIPPAAEAQFAAGTQPSSIWAWVRALRRAERMGLRNEALACADVLGRLVPDSIVATAIRARVQLRHGERGKAADLLDALAKKHGDALPALHAARAGFLDASGFPDEALLAFRRMEAAADGSAAGAVADLFAKHFAKQGWREDQCRQLEAGLAARPGWTRVRRELAECQAALRYDDLSREGFEALANELPGMSGPLAWLSRRARDRGELDEARRWARAWREASPHRAAPLLAMGEIERRARAFERSEAILQEALRIDPDSANPWRALAKTRYQAGNKDGAVAAWRESLARDPNEGRLAQRLAFLSPDEEEAWSLDIPTPAEIRDALATAEGPVGPGAHTVTLLDHEVTVVQPDGSTTDVVTLVVRALDETGRDELTKMNLRRGGRLRLMKAYALSPSGERTQASSVRRRVARFRNLSIGSTVVLQYRHESSPVGYLSRHVARGWWFQSSAGHVRLSEWVLWRPAGTKLHAWINDPDEQVERAEKVIDGFERVAWRAREVPPLQGEPNMPTAREVATNMLVSTVPDWDTFLEWEKALLVDAFREDAAIERLARQIVGNARTPRSKALRIHEWLMKEIRYQQDYEDHIAGVRPHPATVVVERSYGDCKDKSVLFITLARQVGLQAQFALLRTRPRGPLLEDIPMQQFDHAIVYVPAQEGLPDGFFVDSTADALDLEALRQDDTGVRALVFDAESKEHVWRDIPFRAPKENLQRLEVSLQLDGTGRAVGRLEMLGQGTVGSGLRRLARNDTRLGRAFQGLAARLFGGAVTKNAEVVEIEDLRAPAHLRAQLVVANLTREEGRELRVKLPPVWNPGTLFQLETRAYPLVLGAPRSTEWVTRFELARGLGAKRLPSSVDVDAPCFTFRRRAQQRGQTLVVTQRFESTCERISVADYAEHREHAQTVIRAVAEEVVLTRSSRRRGRATAAL